MRLLISLSSENYIKSIIKIIEDIYCESKNKILYVCMSRPYKVLLQNILNKELDLDRILVIDAITKTVAPETDDIANCIYVPSPTSYDAIISALRVLFKTNKFDYVIFDSLSSLSIYAQINDARIFLNKLINETEIDGDCESLFLCYNYDLDSQLISTFSKMTDKVIRTR